jgi:acyl carrier protein
MEDKVRLIVFEALSELNKYRSSELPIVISDEVILYGSGSPLDSLDLVSIITDVEEKIQDELDLKLSLTDDFALAAQPSPYDSVKNLIDFVVKNVK